MKKIKYIIIIAIFSIFTISIMIVNANLTEITNYVLTDIVKINVKASKVKLKGLKVEIENLQINDLDGIKVGEIKRARISIMPLLITRLNKIDLYGGDFLIHQNKLNKLNVENIIILKKIKETPNKVQSVDKVNIHNMNITYRSDQFKVGIEKSVHNVNGYIDMSDYKNIVIKVNGKVLDDKNKKTGDISVLIKDKYIGLDLKNVFVTNEFMQYVPIDLVSFEKAYVDGSINIIDKKVDLNLKAKADNIKYKDYLDEIDKVDLDLTFKDDKLNLNAIGDIKGDKLGLKLALVEKDLNIAVDFKNMPYSKIKRYSLVDKLKLDVDTKLDLSAKIKLDLNDGTNVNLKDYNIKASSKKIKYANMQLNNTMLSLDSSKKDNVNLISSIKMDNDIASKFNVKGNIDLLNLNSNLKAKIDVFNKGKEYKNINADVILKNEKDRYVLNVNGKKDDIKISLNGSTIKKNLKHKYKLSYKDPHINVLADLSGSKKDVNLGFDLNLQNFKKSAIDIHGLKVSGNFENVISNDRKLTAKGKLDDLWLNYQRLKDVKFDLSFENNVVNIVDLKNDKIYSKLSYNLDNKEINGTATLNNYMIYSTNKKFDVNLLLKKLDVNINGNINKPVVKAYLEPSELIVNNQKLGDLELDLDTVDENLIVNAKMGTSKVAVKYDFENENINADLDIDQKLNNLFNVNGLNAKILTKTNIYGKLNDIFGKLNFNIKDITYNEKKMPELKIMADAKNLNLLSGNKKGIIDIKDISIITENNNVVYNTNMLVDLENIEIDLDLKNRVIDLAKISPELKGKLEINGYLKAKNKDFFGEISLMSNDFSISNNKFENLILLAQADNKGFNIGQGYLEYEKNPLRLEGYMLFNPLTYNIRVLADNFNLAFLKLNKSIKDAKGIANVNLVLNDGLFEGTLKLDDFLLKTRDFDITKTNIDISMVNRDIKINKFNSNINKGKLNVSGDLKIPVITKENIKHKKVNLEDFKLDVEAKNVELRNKTNKLLIDANATLDSKKLVGNLDILKGEVNDLSFLAKKKKKNTNYVSFINEMLYNTIRGYFAKIKLDIKEPINIDIPNYLVIQRIKGKADGYASLKFENGKLKLGGKFDVEEGSYKFNSNEFEIEELNVKFYENSEKINPHIDLKSFTKLDEDKIKILIDSNVDNLFIDVKSSSNKSREELINLLTLNSENLNLSKDLLNFATNTAINQFLNSVTAPLGKKLGLTRFEINTSTDTNKFLSLEALKNTVANIYLQAKLYKNFYLNFKTKIPFDIKSNQSDYDLGVSYDLKGNVNGIIGLRIETDYSKNTTTSFYTGLTYTKEFNYLSDLLKKKKK